MTHEDLWQQFLTQVAHKDYLVYSHNLPENFNLFKNKGYLFVSLEFKDSRWHREDSPYMLEGKIMN